MCGIFGACLNPKMMDKNMTKAAIAKYKLLGMYNVDRGKHSCGIYMNTTISKGVDKDKVFSDFIGSHYLPNPMETGNFTMIGHTRMATNGTHTSENAHPFIVNEEFVLAHNGVIRNIWTLCNKYKINHGQIHVDSLGLAHLINQEGFKILGEYEGFAALLMAKQSEPNSIYIYRGASKKYATGEEEEERPLYYLQCEEGMYFSSIEKSLLAISDSEGDRIKQVEANIVHKITNGVMTRSKFPVNRETVNYGVSINTHGGSAAANYPKPAVGGFAGRSIGATSTPLTVSSPRQPTDTNSSVGTAFRFEPVIPLIQYETLSNHIERYAGKKGIVFHQGRYWVAEGDELSMAHGPYYISKNGVINSHKSSSSGNWYFYHGVMMKSLARYNDAIGDLDLRDSMHNICLYLSKYTDYPICNTKYDLSTNCKNVSTFYLHRWFQDGTMCKNTGFTPKFSDRNYIIRDGLLMSITVQKGLVEECIDKEAYNKAGGKNSASESNTILPPAIILPTVSVQDELPFPDPIVEIKDVTDATKDDWDVTHFYQPFDSVEEARSMFTETEIRAMSYYVADIMVQEMDIYPTNVNDDANVDVQLNLILGMCVEDKRTMYEMWNEKDYKDILDYLLIAKDNPDGKYFDLRAEIEEEDDVAEACEMVPKPVEAIIRDIQSHVTDVSEDNIMRVVVNNILHKPSDDDLYEKALQEYDESGEPPMIDQIIANEQAVIPNGEEIEEVNRNAYWTRQEERDFSVEDIIDDLGTARGNADDLTDYQDDDFAQEVAKTIYQAVDPLLRDLFKLTEKHSEPDLGRHIKAIMGKKVNV